MKEKSLNTGRLGREKRTIGIMIDYYCMKNHGEMKLCDECGSLKEYAFERLLNCPFEEEKPVCSNCTVHCYKPNMRQKVKEVMRYSGPRMLLRHPYLAIMHLIDEKIYIPFELKRAKK